MPGGRLIEYTTTRSMLAPCGREPKLGESRRRAKRYQPPSNSAEAAAPDPDPGPAPDCDPGSGTAGFLGLFAARRGDRQPRDAVADLAQRQPQLLRGGGAIEVGFLQRLDQDLTLLLVQVGL